MRTLARAATSSLVVLAVALTFVIAAVAVVGVLGTRAAEVRGSAIASDEQIGRAHV